MNKKCSICESEIKGFGNNPQPIIKDNKKLTVNDRCCDDCNLSIVLPARYAVRENVFAQKMVNVLTSGKRINEVSSKTLNQRG